MKYYFLIQSWSLGLYKDLYNNKNVTFYSTDKIINPGKTLEIKCFLARAIDKILGTKVKERLGYKYIPLTKDTCILIESGFLRRIDEAFFIRLKNSNVKLCLLLIDSMKADSPDLILAKEKIFNTEWHEVYTIDKDDALQYGWNYIGLNYYSKPNVLSQPIKTDAYFVGGLKGNREDTILTLYRYLKKCDVNVKFELFCHSLEQFQQKLDGKGLYYYTSWRPYEKILKQIASTNCIIEILQENQDCQSIRYFEAIALNKKLLTTNKHIFELPFYDPRYMKYFDEIERIDVSWITAREEVNYHYGNEFSPKVFFEKIEKE